LEANKEYTFEVFTTFDEGDLLPHDWSFVIWTDKETVQVALEDHAKTNFQVQSLAADTPIPAVFPEQQEEIAGWENSSFTAPMLSLEEIEQFKNLTAFFADKNLKELSEKEQADYNTLLNFTKVIETWADEYFYKWETFTQEDILQAMVEEIEWKDTQLSEEEAERLASYIQSIKNNTNGLNPDQQKDYEALSNRLLQYMTLTWSWMFTKMDILNYAVFGGELPASDRH